MATVNSKNPHDGHRERFRKEIIKTGINPSTPEHKVLEYILFHCVPRKDTNELAHTLINKFGSFPAVLEAPERDLYSVDGVNEATVTWLKMIIPVFRYYTAKKADVGKKFNKIEEIGEYIFKQYLGNNSEVFTLLSLNATGKIISFDVIGEGAISCVDISARTVLDVVLRTGASGVVMAHNHPSGLALPSKEDISATIQMKQLLASINVQLLDHVITCNNDYVSLAQSEKFKNIFTK